ncbi:helix-turn-helix transcriptional regulator [Cohnella fermenti]|nr:AraC family transcriptional regulator [Cohnella fermenti]
METRLTAKFRAAGPKVMYNVRQRQAVVAGRTGRGEEKEMRTEGEAREAAGRGASPIALVELEPGRSMGKARCEPGWSWQVKEMPDYDLWYAVAGRGSIAVNGQRHPIAPGCCFTLRPGDRIEAEQHPDERLTVMFVHFQASAAGGTGGFRAPDCRVEVGDTARFESLMGRLLELRDMPPAWAEAEFDCTLKLLLLELYRSERQQPLAGRSTLRQRELVRTASDRLRQGAWTAADFDSLAAEAGVSQRYLSELFKRHTGRTLKTYAAGLRMERARLLLAESGMPITRIAEALGYADLYSFSKLFKEHNGLSPSEYRRRAPTTISTK